MPHEFCSAHLDASFSRVPELTWLPWVGTNFASRPESHRLLIVGESHYVHPDNQADVEKVIADHLAYPEYTRDVVAECMIDQDWSNRTLDNLPRLLFGSADYDRKKFWSDTAFYNFVQVPMHYNRSGTPERPNWPSFVTGWSVFNEVIRLVKPSHCLFIGVEAFNSFNYSMAQQQASFTEVEWTEKVGRTYGRKCSVNINDSSCTLIGVQHLGKYFSWQRWKNHITSRHPDLMEYLEAGKYGI